MANKLWENFRIKNQRRSGAEEPHDRITWIKHGLSELVGTFILAFGLAGLSLQVGGGKIVEFYLLHPVLVGFYAGFIVVGLVLVFFLRWSCDLNPMVTITRMLNGQNTYRYGCYKIIIQLVGALITGLILYGIGQAIGYYHNGTLVVNNAIDATKVARQSFLVSHLGQDATPEIGAIWIFAIEIIMGGLLLFPIFSRSIRDKYRDLLIMLIISMVVWMGVLSGTAAINPARGLAQQIPGLIFGSGNSSSDYSLAIGTGAMLLGNLLAPFLYLLMQGFVQHYCNPLLVAIIKFKNVRSTNMRIDRQENPQVKR